MSLLRRMYNTIPGGYLMLSVSQRARLFCQTGVINGWLIH